MDVRPGMELGALSGDRLAWETAFQFSLGPWRLFSSLVFHFVATVRQVGCFVQRSMGRCKDTRVRGYETQDHPPRPPCCACKRRTRLFV